MNDNLRDILIKTLLLHESVVKSNEHLQRLQQRNKKEIKCVKLKL